MKSIWFSLVAFLIVLLAGHFTVNQPKAPAIAPGLYRVVKVYDGDTIQLNDGQKIRFIGIDTPESHDNPKLRRDVKRLKEDKEKILALGQKAADYSRRLLQDQDVKLEFDVEPKDRYGRTLAYVYLADGTFVNEKIIREGYAYPLTIPPNVKYAKQFKQYFNEARMQRRGLWQ